MADDWHKPTNMFNTRPSESRTNRAMPNDNNAASSSIDMVIRQRKFVT